MSKLVDKAIDEFLNKKETNKTGQVITAVVEDDKEFMRNFLPRFYDAYKMFFKDETVAEENFCKNLSVLTAIRFDGTDQNVEPLSGAYQSMRQTNKGKLEGGLCWVGEGFAFILDTDMMVKTKEEATHTAIHEMIHLMTLVSIIRKDKKRINRVGLCIDINDKVAYFLNEGFTEKLAQITWSRMYPNVKCPGIGRYDINVQTINLILNQLGNEDEVIEDFLTDSRQVIDRMKNQTDENNKDLYTYVHEFAQQDVGNVNVQKKFEKNLKSFVYNNQNSIQI